MRCKPVELFIILVTAFLSAITSLTVVTRYQHLDWAYIKIETKENDNFDRNDLVNNSGMSNRSSIGHSYAHIHDGYKWLSERMRSISALQPRLWYRRIYCAYSTTSVFPNCVTDIFRQTSQYWCVGTGRPHTASGRHRVTYTSAHGRHKSLQQVPQRRQSVQKKSFVP